MELCCRNSSISSSESESEAESSSQEDTAESKAAREAARKQIEEDLAFYTKKFEKHANEAIDSLHAKVDQIVIAAINKRKPTVEQQMKKLDKTIENELRALKATIINLAKFHKPGSSEEEATTNKLDSFNKLFEATSSVGKLIKDTVQDMRWDSQKFLAEVFDEVAAEADIRVEKVDSIIDSGIQELGMKWAWEQDGVTFKDWARYQDLKKEFSAIKTQVVQAAEKNQKLIEITKWAESEAWEGGVNARAKEVTDELGRLKRIAKKKIELNDYSEDFSDKYLTVEEASDSEVPPKEAAEPARNSMGIVFAEAHVIAGEQRFEIDDEDLMKDSLTERLKDSIDDLKDNIKDSVDHASKAVSEAIYGTKTEKQMGESITSVAGELYSSAWSAASSALYGTPEPGYMGIATDKYSAAVAAASSILYSTPTPVPFHEQAYAKYHTAVKHAADKYQQVLHDANVAINGEPQPAHESIISAAGEKYSSALKVAQEKYTSVLDSASTAIYGTPQPAHESILSVANEKYTAAVFAAQDNYSKLVSRASTVVIGTPTPVTESIASAISEKVHEIADKVSSAEKIASEKVYGTPQPLSESIVSRAAEAAESAKAYAGEKVEAAGEAAESIKVYAGEKVEQVASVVSENAEAASSKVVSMMTPPPVVENILSSANERLQEIVDIASERIYGREKGTFEKATSAVGDAYDSASSRVSEAVYGKETGAFESAVNMISEAAKSASAEISIAVYGTPKSPLEKATSIIAENVDTATSVVQENYEAAKSAVVEAIYGKEEEKYYASIVESAGTSLQRAVESANAKLVEIYEASKTMVPERVEEMMEDVKAAAEGVSEALSDAASSAAEKVKEGYEKVRDEL